MMKLRRRYVEKPWGRTNLPAMFDAPTGSVVINQGAQYTSSRTVTLTFTTVDASTVTGVCMSSTTACTAYVAFAPTKTWTLNVANGVASVNVWFKDQFGNVSTAQTRNTESVIDAVVSTVRSRFRRKFRRTSVR